MGKHVVSRRKQTTKILASVVLVAGAASVAGMGTFGAFTSTTSASQSVSAGKLVIGLTQHANAGTTVAATNLVPGDTVQRAVTLTRSGETEAFGSVRLTTVPTVGNLLSSDTVNGLQLKVDQCSTGWAKVGTTSELGCSGTQSVVLASRAVVGSNLDLPVATTALNAAGAAANLRISLSLPESADNSFQGLSNTVGFTFDATQRTAQFK